MNGAVGFFFVFVAVTEYVIVSENKKQSKKKKREQRRLERDSNLCRNIYIFKLSRAPIFRVVFVIGIVILRNGV
jgi:hypothetical protein